MARRSTRPWPPDATPRPEQIKAGGARASADQAVPRHAQRNRRGLTGPPGLERPRLPVSAADPAAERLAVQLPDAGERDRVEDGHLARVLVRREPLPGE